MNLIKRSALLRSSCRTSAVLRLRSVGIRNAAADQQHDVARMTNIHTLLLILVAEVVQVAKY
jgi:hypothetical protein